MTDGVEIVKRSGLYDYVQAVVELDESYKCFSDKSRYFLDGIHSKDIAEDIASRYGYYIIHEYLKYLGKDPITQHNGAKENALGFGNCQLLMSMHHNTPDNTLPIIWFDEVEGLWTPIFKRYNKVY